MFGIPAAQFIGLFGACDNGEVDRSPAERGDLATSQAADHSFVFSVLRTMRLALRGVAKYGKHGSKYEGSAGVDLTGSATGSG
jgi:hypothetical protein